MEQIQCDRGPGERVVEKIRDIDAEEGCLRDLIDQRVLHVIEHPRIVTLGALAPACESRVNTLRLRGIGELNQPGEAPRRQIQRERAHERMVEVGLFSYGERYSSTNQRTQP